MSASTLPLDTQDMGRVLVSAKIENSADLREARNGVQPLDDVRRIEVDNALVDVDTGCIGLALPAAMIAGLGLQLLRTRNVQTTNGIRQSRVFDTVDLTIQGRTCTVEVYEIPNDCPVLIGQVPLEILDFVVDPRSRRLVGNPDHEGEWLNEMF